MAESSAAYVTPVAFRESPPASRIHEQLRRLKAPAESAMVRSVHSSSGKYCSTTAPQNAGAPRPRSSPTYLCESDSRSCSNIKRSTRRALLLDDESLGASRCSENLAPPRPWRCSLGDRG